MCGISGYLNFDAGQKTEINVIKKITDVISHRGPDGEGFFVKDNVALGHRRLSIIDLSTGDQPMFNDDKSIAIVFNGEIYNYIELRAELQDLGYKFRTTSDTEVIIRAYEHWGFECQQRLNGMWAFAIWDDRKKQLFISRDRIGEKPLHYCVNNGTFIFGSEIKCILAFNLRIKEINNEVLELYLTLGYVPAPNTFYKNIYKLLPGHYIVVKDRSFKQIKYWDLPDLDEDNMNENKSEIYDEFEYLLTDSVKIRMRSDVPFGAFLSGGLDSSSIVYLMSRVSDYPVQTFTIGFDYESFDERGLARLVADRFNCKHREETVSSKEESFEQYMKEVIIHFDEPFGDSSAIPTAQVSRFAKKYVKMVLTGDGGDETLSGYTSYQGEKFVSQYQVIPQFLRTLIHNFLSLSQKSFKGNIRYQINRVKSVSDSAGIDFEKRLISKVSWAEPEVMKSLLKSQKGLISIEDYISDFNKECKYKNNFYKLIYYNFKFSLPDDILTKVDRMSMAHSLETRIPFLDYRLIESMTRVHKKIKMEGYERKSILRRTIANNLPKELLSARKNGFVAPLREWFKESQHINTLKNVYNSNIALDSNVLMKIVNENINGEKDYGNFIWILSILIKWLE